MESRLISLISTWSVNRFIICKYLRFVYAMMIPIQFKKLGKKCFSFSIWNYFRSAGLCLKSICKRPSFEVKRAQRQINQSIRERRKKNTLWVREKLSSKSFSFLLGNILGIFQHIPFSSDFSFKWSHFWNVLSLSVGTCMIYWGFSHVSHPNNSRPFKLFNKKKISPLEAFNAMFLQTSWNKK